MQIKKNYSMSDDRRLTNHYVLLLKREIILQHGKVRKVSVQLTQDLILIFHMRSMYDAIMW
jgi:hypothetical protein